MRGTTSVLLSAAVLVAVAGDVQAQDGYLFRQPQVTFSLRAGAAAPAASDDLFKFFTEQLSLEKKDFQAAAFAAELSARVSPRVDLSVGVATSKSTSTSHFREFVDQDDQEIEQTTILTRTPLSFSAKVHLRERGQRISQFAWVPVSFQPYVGAGVGAMFYDLEQYGDFVDFETMDVFGDNFRSNGSAPLFQVMGGTELWLNPRVGLTVDGRYTWSSAKLKFDFSDFDSIDLRGFQLTTGLAVRF